MHCEQVVVGVGSCDGGHGRRGRDVDDEGVFVDVMANDVVVHLNHDALLTTLRDRTNLLDGNFELGLDSAFQTVQLERN